MIQYGSPHCDTVWHCDTVKGQKLVGKHCQPVCEMYSISIARCSIIEMSHHGCQHVGVWQGPGVVQKCLCCCINVSSQAAFTQKEGTWDTRKTMRGQLHRLTPLSPLPPPPQGPHHSPHQSVVYY